MITRTLLQQNFPGWYVDTQNGNDSNDGLTTTTAKKTIMAVITMLYQSIDCAGQQPTIWILPGSTVTEQVGVFGQVPGAAPEIFIRAYDPAVQIPWVLSTNQTAIQARDNGICTVIGFAFSATGTGCCFINPSQQGVIDYQNINFGTCVNGWHIRIENGGHANCLDTSTGTTITGSMSAHILISGPGSIHAMGGATINIPQPIQFYCFVQANGLCMLNWGFNSFTGAGSGTSSTGTQYNIVANAVFSKQNTICPGNNPGSAASGGIVE